MIVRIDLACFGAAIRPPSGGFSIPTQKAAPKTEEPVRVDLPGGCSPQLSVSVGAPSRGRLQRTAISNDSKIRPRATIHLLATEG